MIVLESVACADDASAVAQKLIDALTRPFAFGEHEVFMTASIGIALYPHDDREADNLLKYADTAMYRAKEQGRNAYRFYSAEMTARVREHLRLRTQLRRALERDEFEIHYQPIVDLASGRIEALEALVRWRHPESGLLGAGQFIPTAEESDLIVPIGEWVLRGVCADLRAWKGAVPEPVRVAVNISPRQFADPNFVSTVGCMKCLLGGQSGCAGIVEFEITESVLMQNERTIADTLRTFRERGIRLAIDDFGIGYSSLEYLTRFRVDSVKIDQSFIRDMTINPDTASLVAAIIAMVHTLRLKVVAEGVETAEQLALLRRYGCDLVQGYYLSRPVRAAEIVPLLNRGLAPE